MSTILESACKVIAFERLRTLFFQDCFVVCRTSKKSPLFTNSVNTFDITHNSKCFVCNFCMGDIYIYIVIVSIACMI